MFYLRTENFGFAAPSGAIAIVEAIPSAIEDRRLVIARVGEKILARRVLRSPKSGVLALTAETPDPRKSPPTEQVAESDVALHRVVGVLFEESGVISREKTEAIAVAESKSLVTVRSAYRIKEDSAVPLALEGQIALGGQHISLAEFNGKEGWLVALNLDDGSSVFKRVGAALPTPLSHLRQFESIGGLGASDVFSLGEPQRNIKTIIAAVAIVGVLYHS